VYLINLSYINYKNAYFCIKNYLDNGSFIASSLDIDNLP
jgi:hypothetical protein